MKFFPLASRRSRLLGRKFCHHMADPALNPTQDVVVMSGRDFVKRHSLRMLCGERTPLAVRSIVSCADDGMGAIQKNGDRHRSPFKGFGRMGIQTYFASPRTRLMSAACWSVLAA